MTLTFVPPDGYRNTTSFPTKPSSEAEFRDSMQDLLDQIKDYLNALNPWGDNTLSVRSSFKAAITVNQLIGAGVFTKISHDGEFYDNLGEYDSFNRRFVAAKAGEYLFYGSINTSSAPDTNVIIQALYINGVRKYDLGSSAPIGGGGSASAQGSTSVRLSLGDTVEVYVYSTAAITIAAGDAFTFFGGIQIG